MAFDVLRYVVFGCAILIGISLAVNPQRFFWLLSYGRKQTPVPAKLVLPFRVLGVFNALGSIYLIIRWATGE
jgi:hypothetical protein